MKLVDSVMWIVGSMLVVSVAGQKGISRYHKHYRDKKTSPHYFLCRIVQTGPQREALHTTYLAELMKISADRPVTIAHFNTESAQQQLLESPVIKTARVKIFEPDTLYVDYTVRKPIAWLYDFENTAVDEEGYPFPVFPFFTPKRLPELYLGIQTFAWHHPLNDKHSLLALKILSTLSQYPLDIRRLDVSKGFTDSLGTREVVVIIDENGFSKTLRLTPKNYPQELGNYLQLRSQLPAIPQIIDLRIPQLAFINEEKVRKPQSHSS